MELKLIIGLHRSPVFIEKCAFIRLPSEPPIEIMHICNFNASALIKYLAQAKSLNN
jgi:hypothetical protein